MTAWSSLQSELSFTNTELTEIMGIWSLSLGLTVGGVGTPQHVFSPSHGQEHVGLHPVGAPMFDSYDWRFLDFCLINEPMTF